MFKKISIASFVLAVVSTNSFAVDGGSVTLPVSVGFTGADRCVPSALTAQTIAITHTEVASAETSNPFVGDAIVKSQSVPLNFTNCPVGTRLKISSGAGSSSGTSVPMMDAGGGQTNAGDNGAMWPLTGAAANKMYMSIYMVGPNTSAVASGSAADSNLYSLTTANTMNLRYAIIAKKGSGAKDVVSGTYTGSAVLNIEVR